MPQQFSAGALQRRFKRVAPGAGTPGPSGGKSDMAPHNKKRAGSMFTPNPKTGRVFKALHNLPKPR